MHHLQEQFDSGQTSKQEILSYMAAYPVEEGCHVYPADSLDSSDELVHDGVSEVIYCLLPT